MKHFDLTPHPRILPMLGEIVLPQWRCLAELIDNSIDSFIEALRAGIPVQNPHVSISVPTGGSSQGSRLTVRDNGPGMESDTLEQAARAGWTSHGPDQQPRSIRNGIQHRYRPAWVTDHNLDHPVGDVRVGWTRDRFQPVDETARVHLTRVEPSQTEFGIVRDGGHH